MSSATYPWQDAPGLGHAQGHSRQESREAALDKTAKVVADLRAMRLQKAAELVERSVSETLAYYSYPQTHWLKIRTNNPLERIMRRIRRRTRVVVHSLTAIQR